MAKLPDFEALAIFAKVVELRSFANAASELALSKATVSKAVTRLEERLGARLFNRTSRRLALTDAGQRLSERAARLPDSSLIARRLCAMPRYTVAAPAYLKRHGRPTHPMHLAQHKCFGYAYLSTPNLWHYTNAAGEQASVRPAGQLRANNGEALMPALLAGLGIADLPDFIVGDAIASGEVEVILKGWKQPEGAVHLVTPPGGPRPARVEVLADFLTKKFAKWRRKP